MKFLRWSLKILGIFILLILIVLFVTPYFFKTEITEFVKIELNNNIEGQVDFESVDISLFRNFPDFSIRVNTIRVQDIKGKEILNCQQLTVVVDLFALMGDDIYEVKSILVDHPVLTLTIDEALVAEQDVEIHQSKEIGKPVKTSTAEAPITLKIKRLAIRNAAIFYEDTQAGIRTEVHGLNFALSGNLSESRTTLFVDVSTPKLDFYNDGNKLLNNLAVTFTGNIDADLKNEIYTFQKNELLLNRLALQFEGSVAMVNDDPNLMFTFKTPDNNFKQLLSLVPDLYAEHFSTLETSGTFTLDGFVKGMYTEESLPAFQLNVGASDAMLSYPEMPGKLSDIQIDLSLKNTGGEVDATVIDLKLLQAKLLQDPFSFKLYLTHPVSDPHMDAHASGTLNLSNLSQVFPHDLGDLAGVLLLDMRLKGSLSAVEEKRYKDFLAMGSMVAKDLKYLDKGFSEAIHISHAQLNFSPEHLDLSSFEFRVGQSQVSATGRVQNYLAYYLKDDVLSGDLKINSPYIKVNELMEPWKSEEADESLEDKTEEESETDTSAKPEDSQSEVIEIPDNINFKVSLQTDHLIYDSLEMKELMADLHIHDQRLEINKLSAEIMGGKTEIKGFYATPGNTDPQIDLQLMLKSVDIAQSYASLVLFRQFVPMAAAASGQLSMSLGLSTDLNQHMKPKWSSVAGHGRMRSKKLSIEQAEFFKAFNLVLNSEMFENIHTGPIDVNFKLEDGKIHHKPFKVQLNGVEAEIAGWTSFDQQIDYSFNTELPIEMAGDEAASLIKHYIDEGNNLGFNLESVKTIKLGFGVTGTAKKPKIKLLSTAKGSGTSIEKVLKDTYEEKKEELLNTGKEEAAKIMAEAKADADAIIKEAQKQVDELNRLAKLSAEDFKKESQKQADALIAEAKKNGPVAAMVAKEAAKELLKEGDKHAAEAVKRAAAEADKILKEAQKQADQIMKDAEKKAKEIK